MSQEADITALLDQYQSGDSGALEALMPLVYSELKRIARRQLSGSDLTALNTTGLVNEVYCKMAAQKNLSVNSRGHFFAVAARAMRQLLVDHLRARFAAKRNDGVRPLPLNDEQVSAPDQAEFWLRVDHAMESMAHHDPRLVQILECQVFAGYSLEETAQSLGVSLRTVQRDWMRAKAWLCEALETG